MSNRHSSRRRSSLNVEQERHSGTGKRRPSSTLLSSSNVRHSARTTMHDINLQLGRTPSTETPTNRKERKARRKSRQKDYARQQENRTDRMETLNDRWCTHRKSFVEVEQTHQKGGFSWSSCCCGLDLCCGW